METQDIIETLYTTEDILRKRIPFNEDSKEPHKKWCPRAIEFLKRILDL